MALPHLKRETLLKIVQEGYLLTLSLTLSALLVLFGYVIGNAIAPRIRGKSIQSAQSQISPRDLAAFEQEIFDLVNAERDDRHLTILSKDGKLQVIADKRAEYLFTMDQYTHGGWKRFFEEGDYCFRVAGENLAKDYEDPGSLVDDWLESESHREVMLNKSYTHGAVVQKGSYTIFLFSLPCD